MNGFHASVAFTIGVKEVTCIPGIGSAVCNTDFSVFISQISTNDCPTAICGDGKDGICVQMSFFGKTIIRIAKIQNTVFDNIEIFYIIPVVSNLGPSIIF